VIREALDAQLDSTESEAAELERFRAAVTDAFGIARYLPSGAEYVDELRAARDEQGGTSRCSRGSRRRTADAHARRGRSSVRTSSATADRATDAPAASSR
jgi:hypothetical protein